MEDDLYDWWFLDSPEPQFTILNHGKINITDGPDIQNIEVSINNMSYKGNAELDYISSNWFSHGHFQNIHYQNVLLHVVMRKTHQNYHGYVPKFTYVIETNELIKNSEVTDFWKRKENFLQTYNSLYSKEDVFLILFARALGFYHNREEMTYLAQLNIRLKEIPIDQRTQFLQSQILPKAKSVRPNNRLHIRLNQFLSFQNHTFLNDIQSIIKSRLQLTSTIKVISEDLSTYITEGSIGKSRISQWLFNGVLPYERFNTPDKNSPYSYYLEDLMEQLKKYPEIAKFHY